MKLTLEPNHDIIAKGASVQYLGQDGKLVRTEEIDRRAHKVFKGDAWAQDHVGIWTKVGWARIVIRRDGIDPLFEGAFAITHDHHHIQLRSNYMSTKHALDPGIEPSDDEYMVIFRDSDIDKRPSNGHTELRRSGGIQGSCRSHELQFNSNPQQTVLKRNVGYWGATPVNSLFGKRQIDTGGIPAGEILAASI